MPKRRDALPADVNQRAHAIMDMATGRRPKPDPDPEPTPAELGGYARAAKLTPEERSESVRNAAKARWDSPPQPQGVIAESKDDDYDGSGSD